MATSSDHNVTETALDAVKCKLSAVKLGYFHDDFLEHFVPKPTRRIPLIHRGYYLRHVAISDCVARFLASANGQTPVQIISLGAGFDTLFFRLMQQPQTAPLRFVEIDCEPIVAAKSDILQAKIHDLLPNHTLSCTTSDGNGAIAFQCQVPTANATYGLAASDLGDIQRLQSLLQLAKVDFSQPTLILAECVVSYIDPAPGTALLKWLSSSFSDATAVLYDPLALDGAFGSILCQYFAVKGCELRSQRGFQSLTDHAKRLVALCGFQSVRIIDMNTIFQQTTSPDEKTRLQKLEPFDEYADWVLCNAHYGIFLASTTSTKSLDGTAHWSRGFCAARGFAAHRLPPPTSGHDEASASAIVRTFQPDDLASVQKLFQATHLEYSCKAVKKFVQNRIKSGDLANVTSSFLASSNSHFWVVETTTTAADHPQIVACIGIKPHNSNSNTSSAELCRLSVDKCWRRRGIATALVQILETFAVESGYYDSICLETIESMTTAQAFYTAKGYSEAPTREKFSTFTLRLASRGVLSRATVHNPCLPSHGLKHPPHQKLNKQERERHPLTNSPTSMSGYDLDYDALGLSHDRFEAFKSVFLKFDKSKTATITTKQLDALCFTLGEPFDPEELAIAIASLANDKTGLVHFATFLKWWISE